MSRKKNLLVGITGGIGAGKSLISRIFSLLGVPIYNADNRAKWLMAHDATLKKRINAQFGESAYTATGELNSSYLAEKVFADPTQTEKINQLVHPAVCQDFTDWANRQVADYVLKEAALLFETGTYRELDVTVHVTAPQEMRIDRVMKRDRQRSRQQILQIMEKQWGDAKKNSLATYILPNDEKELVIPRVLEIHEEIRQRAANFSE